jgi:Zn finger protein HypA/HybF involved in hydrogenase expression
MVIACKCRNCGHLALSEGPDVTFEIDFAEEKITMICPQCKHNNILDLSGSKAGKKNKGSLPAIGIMRG